MSNNGIFTKKLNGFNPEEVLDYIEQLQNDKVVKENELLKQITDLEKENESLKDKLQSQVEINQSFKDKVSECEYRLNELFELTNTYSEDSHKAVKIDMTSTQQPATEQKSYKINESRFDVIKNKIASIGNLIKETKKLYFE
ncbi:MAG: hypothetical protein UHN02_07970 [Acutalibacteraceae bacterium]|nr:hypothetical protein [Acutalibacteraceae bacterium]